MTVIAAIAHNGTVTIGSDTVACSGAALIYKSESKIVEFTAVDASGHSAKVLIAAAGNASVMPALTHGLHLEGAPTPTDTDEVADSWAIATAHAITGVLADSNPPMITGAGEDPASLDSSLLLAVHGHLWLIFTNAAIRPHNRILTLGSGGDLATGALLAALKHGATPEAAINDAINWASTYSDGCRVDERGPRIHTTAKVRKPAA